MCGIAGKVYADPQRQVEESLLRAMCRAIAHRGPDDEGVYRSGPVGLGMRRLKVIDLEGGHQPMGNAEGWLWIVFNGEIYNYRQLRRELEEEGRVFRTQSDTETILHLYERQGEGCLQRLRGMFAFALWDQRRQTLMLARDRLGKKPLFYADLAEGLTFGSEISALLRDPALPRDLDLEAIDEYLTCLFVPGPRTIFRRIRKLPPASYALYSGGGLEIHSYWSPALEPRGAERPEESYLEELACLLREAVSLRMISDVPLGAFLSGGLDSSLVVALMGEVARVPVETFCVGFNEASFSELEHARTVAGHLGTRHHEHVVDYNIGELLPSLVEHFGEPFADSSAVPMYHLSRIARQHVTVALSGDGADELFAGYRRYLGRRLAGWYNHWPGWAGRGALEALGSRLPDPPGYYGFSRRKKFKRFLEYAAALRENEQLSWEFFFSGKEKKELYKENFADNIKSTTIVGKGLGDSPIADPVAAMIAKDLRLYLPDDILTKVDRMSMACSLEVRAPFLDHHLVEFALALPMKHRLRGGQGKYLLRRLACKLLPKNAVARPKQGFTVPLAAWFRGELRDWLHQALLAPGAAIGEFFEPRVVRGMIERHGRQRDMSQQLWALLVLEVWHRQVLRGR
jgi:asparagine synthase (glutamine-hydrolysing)